MNRPILILPQRLEAHALDQAHFSDIAVYLHLCRLDDTAGESTFRLPHRDEMERLTRCSHQLLARSYSCLESLGLLVFAGVSSRRIGTPRRVRLERVRPSITTETTTSEGVTSWTPRFSGELIRFHASCRRSDRHSNTLADFPLEYLYELAGGPLDQDLQRAIAEVEAFDRPAGGFIHSIISVFLSRFKRDTENKLTGKLDPGRKNIMHTVNPGKKKKTSQSPDLERCNIFPTKEHPAAVIDWICYALSDGQRDIMAGDVPLYMLEKPSILRDENNRLSLAPGATLQRVAAGYWLSGFESKVTA